ncbi:FecR family protein [Bacteroidota bacterium]
MAEINIDDLILQYLSDELSDKELKNLKKWINQSKANKKYFETTRDAWIASSIVKAKTDYNPSEAWQRVDKRIYSKKYLRLKQFMKVAAIFLIAFVSGVFATYLLNNLESKQQLSSSDKIIIKAPYGSKSFVTLADGSKIWLNAGSKIEYTQEYNSSNRNMYLEGEAYFEVAKNKKIPFQVYVGNVKVKALGTAFNIKAYDDEDKIETTLVEGSVEIIDQNKKIKAIYLEPNQKAVIKLDKPDEEKPKYSEKNKTKSFIDSLPKIKSINIKTDVKTELTTSWKEKQWIIESETLVDFTKKLERRYDVQFQFEHDYLKQFRFSGKLKEETLQEVLTVLQLTAPIDFTIKQGIVYITDNKTLLKKHNQYTKKN